MPDPSALSTGFASLDEEPTLRVRVWDLPTRLFHWALAVVVIGLLVTGLAGIMEWHFRLGYVALSLLAFRILWGFVGGRWSRFAAFVYSPGSLGAYLKGRAHPDHLVGHTPLGALAVFVMLALLVLQVSTGLVSDDEVSSSGPLAHFVSSATVKLASGWHSVWGKWLIIAVVSLHVLAILFYTLVRHQHIVRPMVTGDKITAHHTAASHDSAGSRVAALVLFALCGTLAFWISTLRT